MWWHGDRDRLAHFHNSGRTHDASERVGHDDIAIAATSGKRLPPQLSHALIFYTTGEIVKEAFPGHIPLGEKAGVWNRGLAPFKPVLERQDNGAEVMDPAKAEASTRAVVERISAEVDQAKLLADDRFQVFESVNLRVLEQGNWREYTRQRIQARARRVVDRCREIAPERVPAGCEFAEAFQISEYGRQPKAEELAALFASA